MIFAKIPSDNLNNRPLQSRKTPILKNTVFSIKPSRIMNKIYKTNGIFFDRCFEHFWINVIDRNIAIS